MKMPGKSRQSSPSPSSDHMDEVLARQAETRRARIARRIERHQRHQQRNTQQINSNGNGNGDEVEVEVLNAALEEHASRHQQQETQSQQRNSTQPTSSPTFNFGKKVEALRRLTLIPCNYTIALLGIFKDGFVYYRCDDWRAPAFWLFTIPCFYLNCYVLYEIYINFFDFLRLILLILKILLRIPSFFVSLSSQGSQVSIMLTSFGSLLSQLKPTWYTQIPIMQPLELPTPKNTRESFYTDWSQSTTEPLLFSSPIFESPKYQSHQSRTTTSLVPKHHTIDELITTSSNVLNVMRTTVEASQRNSENAVAMKPIVNSLDSLYGMLNELNEKYNQFSDEWLDQTLMLALISHSVTRKVNADLARLDGLIDYVTRCHPDSTSVKDPTIWQLLLYNVFGISPQHPHQGSSATKECRYWDAEHVESDARDILFSVDAHRHAHIIQMGQKATLIIDAGQNVMSELKAIKAIASKLKRNVYGGLEGIDGIKEALEKIREDEEMHWRRGGYLDNGGGFLLFRRFFGIPAAEKLQRAEKEQKWNEKVEDIDQDKGGLNDLLEYCEELYRSVQGSMGIVANFVTGWNNLRAKESSFGPESETNDGPDNIKTQGETVIKYLGKQLANGRTQDTRVWKITVAYWVQGREQFGNKLDKLVNDWLEEGHGRSE